MKINEGGNTIAVSKTGKQTKAEKIPIKKIGRKNFYNQVVKLFKQMNKDYRKMFGTDLWTDESIIENGFVFNGSTSFIMDPTIPDEEVVKYKETAGDLDIVVPEYTKENIFNYLQSKDQEEIIKGVRYMGSNKPTLSSIGGQINCVFVFDFDGLKVPAQVDFEFLPFSETGIPTEWAKFSHSSSFDDCKAGIKAVHHKYLLRSITYGASVRDDILVCTPKSTWDNIKISKSKESSNPRTLKFSVYKGLRIAYEPLLDPDGNPVYMEGRQVFKCMPTSESSFVTDVAEIFKLTVRPDDITDLEKNAKKFWSFLGILEILKEYSTKDQIKRIHDRYIDLLWGLTSQKGQRAQELERDNPELDYKVKIGGYLKFIETFGLPDKSKDMAPIYYEDYGHQRKGPEIDPMLEESFKGYLKSKNFSLS